MAKALIVPKANLQIPIPGRPGKRLPESGEIMEVDKYWLRREREGAVEILYEQASNAVPPSSSPSSQTKPDMDDEEGGNY